MPESGGPVRLAYTRIRPPRCTGTCGSARGRILRPWCPIAARTGRNLHALRKAGAMLQASGLWNGSVPCNGCTFFENADRAFAGHRASKEPDSTPGGFAKARTTPEARIGGNRMPPAGEGCVALMCLRLRPGCRRAGRLPAPHGHLRAGSTGECAPEAARSVNPISRSPSTPFARHQYNKAETGESPATNQVMLRSITGR